MLWVLRFFAVDIVVVDEGELGAVGASFGVEDAGAVANVDLRAGSFWATGVRVLVDLSKNIYRVEGVVVKAGGFGIDQDFLFVVGELILEGAAACRRVYRLRRGLPFGSRWRRPRGVS